MRACAVLLAIGILALPVHAQLFDMKAKGIVFTPRAFDVYDVGMLWEFGVIGSAPTQGFDVELRIDGVAVASVRCDLTRLAGTATCEDAGPPCLGPCPPYRISMNPFSGEQEWDLHGECDDAPLFDVNDPDRCWCLYDVTVDCSTIAAVPIPPGSLCSIHVDALGEIGEASETNNTASALVAATVPALPGWGIAVLSIAVLVAGGFVARRMPGS